MEKSPPLKLRSEKVSTALFYSSRPSEKEIRRLNHPDISKIKHIEKENPFHPLKSFACIVDRKGDSEAVEESRGTTNSFYHSGHF